MKLSGIEYLHPEDCLIRTRSGDVGNEESLPDFTISRDGNLVLLLGVRCQCLIDYSLKEGWRSGLTM